jgi:hypothetical protein
VARVNNFAASHSNWFQIGGEVLPYLVRGYAYATMKRGNFSKKRKFSALFAR